MGCNLLMNGVNWGYNPFTNHLLVLTSWDIQVLDVGRAMVVFSSTKLKTLPCFEPQNWRSGPSLIVLDVYTHKIHGTCIFTHSYMNGWFVWQMYQSHPVPGSYGICKYHKVILLMFHVTFFLFFLFCDVHITGRWSYIIFCLFLVGMNYSKPWWIQRAYRPGGSRSEKSVKLTDLTMEHGVSQCCCFPQSCPRA